MHQPLGVFKKVAYKKRMLDCSKSYESSMLDSRGLRKLIDLYYSKNFQLSLHEILYMLHFLLFCRVSRVIDKESSFCHTTSKFCSLLTRICKTSELKGVLNLWIYEFLDLKKLNSGILRK